MRNHLTLPLTPSDLDKLGKFLGMLGSDFAGERATAAMKADKLIKDCGSSWPALTDGLKALTTRPAMDFGSDVFRPKHRHPHQPMPGARPAHAGVEHQRRAMMCRIQECYLSLWECNFLDGVMSVRTLSPKQRATLNGIEAKIDAAIAAEREVTDVHQY